MFSFDLLLVLTHLIKPFLLSNTRLVSVNSIWALDFLIFPLQIQTASLYSPCEARPCFWWSYVFFFHLSSRQSSLFRQDSLLPGLLEFWHNGIACSWVFKSNLKNDHFPCTIKPPRADFQGSLLTSSL